MGGNYSVQIEDFAERHFIKSFRKKYKTYWDITMKAIVAELERIDNLLLTDRAKIICDAEDVKIIKIKFRVAGTKESANASGNRCIVAWHLDKQFVSLLLLYSKTDLGGDDETTKWKKIIRDNYPQYKKLF